jgi:hypothetical protein
MKTFKSILTNILFVLILVMIGWIWHRSHPTAGENASAKGSEKDALQQQTVITNQSPIPVRLAP